VLAAVNLEGFVGAWKLVSFEIRGEDGEVDRSGHECWLLSLRCKNHKKGELAVYRNLVLSSENTTYQR
jgi:hypothetical protein